MLFIIVMTHVRITGLVMLSMRASQNLHDIMFTNLIAAVMRFFDTNPSGEPYYFCHAIVHINKINNIIMIVTSTLEEIDINKEV